MSYVLRLGKRYNLFGKVNVLFLGVAAFVLDGINRIRH